MTKPYPMKTMTSTAPLGVLPRSFSDFRHDRPTPIGANLHWRMRAQNFWVEYIEAQPGSFPVASPTELLLMALDAPVEVRTGGAAGPLPVTLAPGCVSVLPAGSHVVVSARPGRCVVLASSRPDIEPATVLNQEAYSVPDPRIEPAGRRYRRQADVPTTRIYDMSSLPAPADNPRLKMLQTETMSINWVAYEGARNRSALSPHSHASCEQGTLALAGDFVHHLRVNWGRDANQWRDDEHLPAPSPSLLVVPVELVHTTEGVGGGRHLLIDIFSPPRADFIAKGWVHNASDYETTAP